MPEPAPVPDDTVSFLATQDDATLRTHAEDKSDRHSYASVLGMMEDRRALAREVLALREWARVAKPMLEEHASDLVNEWNAYESAGDVTAHVERLDALLPPPTPSAR